LKKLIEKWNNQLLSRSIFGFSKYTSKNHNILISIDHKKNTISLAITKYLSKKAIVKYMEIGMIDRDLYKFQGSY
jgi:hypothetical protein